MSELFQATITLLSKASGVLASATIVILLQKFSGTEVQGLYGLVVASTQLCMVVFMLGVPSYAARELAKFNKNDYEGKKRIQDACLCATAGGLIFSLPFQIYLFGAFGVTGNASVLSMLIVIFSGLAFLFSYGLRAQGMFSVAMFLTDSLKWILLLVALVVFFFICEVNGEVVVSLMALSSFSLLLVCAVLARRVLHWRFPSVIYAKEILRCYGSGIPMMLASLSVLAMLQANVIQLGFYSNLTEVGNFNLANKLLAFATLPLAVFSSVYGQKVIGIRDSQRALKAHVLKVIGLSFAAATFSLVILYMLAPLFYRSMGSEMPVDLIRLIVLSYEIYSIYYFVVIFFGMLGRVIPVAILSASGVLVNVVASYFLVPELGAYGSAISDIISHSYLLSVIMAYLVYRWRLGL